MADPIFEDPSDDRKRQILKDWPHSASMMISYVKDIFPGWIQNTAKQYSIDLAKFNIQWASSCHKLNTRPGRVILVSNTFLKERSVKDHRYTLIDEIIKRLSESGHVIVDTDIFTTCSGCHEIIVSQTRMESNRLSFSGKCQRCFPYDPKKPLP